VHTVVSDFAIGGVLMQDGKPIAFGSKKLDDTYNKWPTHEKEILIIEHWLII